MAEVAADRVRELRDLADREPLNTMDAGNVRLAADFIAGAVDIVRLRDIDSLADRAILADLRTKYSAAAAEVFRIEKELRETALRAAELSTENAKLALALAEVTPHASVAAINIRTPRTTDQRNADALEEIAASLTLIANKHGSL